MEGYPSINSSRFRPPTPLQIHSHTLSQKIQSLQPPTPHLHQTTNTTTNKVVIKLGLATRPIFGDVHHEEEICTKSNGELRMMAFAQEELWENLVSVLLCMKTWRVNKLFKTKSMNSFFFYPNALCAVTLSPTVSRSLSELAVKVVATNMVRTGRSLSGTHLLCVVGRYQEACSQLQDAGCWTDATTLAVTHLKGSDYSRVMKRWAEHVLNADNNMWSGMFTRSIGGVA
ncbi:unnamed protein product [Lactuca saligna]|uniref:WDR11 TPR domain-containing protein n=1 Tax=Lactuca saligna TaxID=75948 RepID=A0AA35Z2F8_LACSI|nr:unnamed protein product [Lactuca saligna]